jgi:hypothetical protein
VRTFLRVNLLVAVGLTVLALAAPAHASPISAHAMIHSCCMEDALEERIFTEAKQLGSEFIRVDIEMDAIFEAPDGTPRNTPNWAALNDVVERSKRHDLPVLGILLAPPAYTSACPERWPDSRRCAAADAEEFGRLAGEIAAHASPTIRHWEIVNEPDGEWAFEGTPEEYARMLSAAYDGIKERVPEATVVFGGLMRPHELGWVERVFATPGADAIHKFDIANIHLRGPVGAVVRRYGEFRSWLAARGFSGPVWVTEHGYPADPAFQVDRAYTGGDPAQAAYLTETVVGLGEAGAEQVFVTLRDNLEGEYASEGLVNIGPAPDHPVTRRASFTTLARLARDWDQVMTWRREQRAFEQQARVLQASAAISAGEARTARAKFRVARLNVHEVQDDLAAGARSRRVKKRLERRLARARALVAGRRTALLWHTAIGRYQRERAAQHVAIAAALKQRIAGG